MGERVRVGPVGWTVRPYLGFGLNMSWWLRVIRGEGGGGWSGRQNGENSSKGEVGCRGVGPL